MPRFIWYELVTADPESAMRFYPGVTGWRAEPYGEAASRYWLWINGDAPLGGLMAPPPDGDQASDWPHWMPYVECTDVETTVSAARALGARVYVPPTWIGTGRFAVLADPQGAVFSVFAPDVAATTPERGREGSVVWHELVTNGAAAAMEFYGALFGWERTLAVDLGASGVYQMYGDAGESYGGIYERPRNSAMPPHWLLHLRVRDLDRAAERVKQLGGALLQRGRSPDGCEILECTDAQGARFALTTRTP